MDVSLEPLKPLVVGSILPNPKAYRREDLMRGEVDYDGRFRLNMPAGFKPFAFIMSEDNSSRFLSYVSNEFPYIYAHIVQHHSR